MNTKTDEQAVRDAFDIQRRFAEVSRTEPKAQRPGSHVPTARKSKITLSLLGIKVGNARVEAILGRIEHGVYS